MRKLTTTLCLTIAVLLGSCDTNSIHYESIGAKYVGDTKNGRPHGQGTLTRANGSIYVGEFWQGLPHGQGTFTFTDGSKYVGEHRRGKYHGQGTFTFASGSKYVGEYKDGKRHGSGTYTWVNGSKYVGEYKDGKKHGPGIYTSAVGQTKMGTWEKGKLQTAQKGTPSAVASQPVSQNPKADMDAAMRAARSGDHATAFKFFHRVAAIGPKGWGAMLFLSLSYKEGKGTRKDLLKAYMWSELSLASIESLRSDYPNKKMWLTGRKPVSDTNKSLEKKLSKSEIRTATKLARECVRKKYKGC